MTVKRCRTCKFREHRVTDEPCQSCDAFFNLWEPMQDGEASPGHDAVDHPVHYVSHPSGVECIEVTEHMNFCRGNAMKYLWRAGAKGDAVEDLKKARWYIEREITRLEKEDTP